MYLSTVGRCYRVAYNRSVPLPSDLPTYTERPRLPSVLENGTFMDRTQAGVVPKVNPSGSVSSTNAPSPFAYTTDIDGNTLTSPPGATVSWGKTPGGAGMRFRLSHGEDTHCKKGGQQRCQQGQGEACRSAKLCFHIRSFSLINLLRVLNIELVAPWRKTHSHKPRPFFCPNEMRPRRTHNSVICCGVPGKDLAPHGWSSYPK